MGGCGSAAGGLVCLLNMMSRFRTSPCKGGQTSKRVHSAVLQRKPPQVQALIQGGGPLVNNVHKHIRARSHVLCFLPRFGPRGRSQEAALFNKLLILDAGGRRALFSNNDKGCSIIDYSTCRPPPSLRHTFQSRSERKTCC